MTQEIRGPQQSITDILDFWQSRVQTVLPAFVNSYDPSDQTAEVQPVHAEYYLNDDGTKSLQEYPAIPAVQVWYPRGNGFSMHWPLKKGDLVLLLACQRSIDEYFETDGKTQVIPDELRMHNPSDFIALPGLATSRNKIKNLDATDLLIQHSDGNTKARFKSDGTVSITASRVNLGDEVGAEALALASKVDSNFTAFKTAYDLHIHPTPAGPSTPPTVPMTSPTATPSAKVFTDS